jgi:head-tail adaptor
LSSKLGITVRFAADALNPDIDAAVRLDFDVLRFDVIVVVMVKEKGGSISAIASEKQKPESSRKEM